jgi:hypothetical protein
MSRKVRGREKSVTESSELQARATWKSSGLFTKPLGAMKYIEVRRDKLRTPKLVHNLLYCSVGFFYCAVAFYYLQLRYCIS